MAANSQNLKLSAIRQVAGVRSGCHRRKPEACAGVAGAWEHGRLTARENARDQVGDRIVSIRRGSLYVLRSLTVAISVLVSTLGLMITSVHTIIYADDAESARAFFRDVLELPHVDAHDGWLIFKLPPGELAIHPSGDGYGNGKHQLFLMCDDIERTVEDLKAKGVEFTKDVEDQGFGRITTFRVPGAGEADLYQPRHTVAYDLP